MSKLRITTAMAAIIFASAPLAMAQTTLGGNAKDNSASGGRENGTTAGSGKGMTGSTSAAPSAVAGAGESKNTATGGEPGGRADKN